VAAPCVACLALACGKTSRHNAASGPGTSSGGSDGGSAGSAGASGAGASDCTPIAPRLVRLSLPQLTRALGALLGPELEQALNEEFGIDPMRSFRALDVEGTSFTDGVFAQSDGLAARAGEYVGDHFAEVTGCAETPTYDCVKDFVGDLAERAYRRPVSDAERESLGQVLVEADSLGASVEEAARYGAYAVFESPGFVYRTEFGVPDDSGETRLTPYELASSLAFFITGGPPDQELLDAAAKEQLSTPEAIAPHVERLLSSDAGRANLEAATLTRFGAERVNTVVLDPPVFPTVDRALIDAMSAEARAFVQGTLWGGSVSDLLSSRRTRLNQRLAEHYGLEFPPAGATPDASGFADVELPEEHSGFLTKAAALTALARPERASVVMRGTWMQGLLCIETPPFPDLGSEPLEPLPASTTEREKAEARMATAPCSGCHLGIDPFGLALDEFDAIGRFRTEDENGNPIDPAVTLPAEAGGVAVANAVELGAAVGDQFAACMTKSFLDYALAEGSAELDGCEVEAVLEAQRASADPSFTELVRQVALSKALAVRGAAQP
jgi:hypothetical protein